MNTDVMISKTDIRRKLEELEVDHQIQVNALRRLLTVFALNRLGISTPSGMLDSLQEMEQEHGKRFRLNMAEIKCPQKAQPAPAAALPAAREPEPSLCATERKAYAAAVQSHRVAKDRLCDTCGSPFSITHGELATHRREGSPLAVSCPSCRRQQQAAETEPLTVMKRLA